MDYLNSSDQPVSPEQIARILDELREGETLVRSGLSEKANFEVLYFGQLKQAGPGQVIRLSEKISQII